jgi:hypothetical protein
MIRSRTEFTIIASLGLIVALTFAGAAFGYPIYGAIAFDAIGGLLLLIAAQLQPEIARFMPQTMGWEASPRRIRLRRLLLGFLGVVWMSVAAAGVFTSYGVWWLIGVPLVVSLAVIIADALVRHEMLPIGEESPHRENKRDPRWYSYARIMGAQLALQAIMFVLRQFMDIEIAFAVLFVVVGILLLAMLLLSPWLEPWLYRGQERPTPRMRRRGQWIVGVIGAVFALTGIALYLDMVDYLVIGLTIAFIAFIGFILLALWRDSKKQKPHNDSAAGL